MEFWERELAALKTRIEQEISERSEVCLRQLSYLPHTGRRFHSGSTLPDIEIGEISPISMSRLGADYLM